MRVPRVPKVLSQHGASSLHSRKVIANVVSPEKIAIVENNRKITALYFSDGARTVEELEKKVREVLDKYFHTKRKNFRISVMDAAERAIVDGKVVTVDPETGETIVPGRKVIYDPVLDMLRSEDYTFTVQGFLGRIMEYLELSYLRKVDTKISKHLSTYVPAIKVSEKMCVFPYPELKDVGPIAELAEEIEGLLESAGATAVLWALNQLNDCQCKGSPPEIECTCKILRTMRKGGKKRKVVHVVRLSLAGPGV